MHEARPVRHRRSIIDSLTDKLMGKKVDINAAANADDETPYSSQGRMSVYAQPGVEIRLALRRTPKVLEALGEWWLTAIPFSVDGSIREEVTASEEHSMAKQDYMTCVHKIYKALVKDWDEADCNAVAEAEWIKDADANGQMSRDFFFDAIFELADTYTRSVSEGEYYEFLCKQLQRVARQTADGHYVWKDDAEIEYLAWDGDDMPAPPSPRKAKKRMSMWSRRSVPTAAPIKQGSLAIALRRRSVGGEVPAPATTTTSLAMTIRQRSMASMSMQAAPTALKKGQGSQNSLFGFFNNIERLLNSIRLGSASVAPAA